MMQTPMRRPLQKPLTQEEETALLLEIQGAEQRQDFKTANRVYKILWKRFYPLIMSIVTKNKGFSLSVEDIEAEAHFAFVHTYRKFNPELGFRFSTLLQQNVRGYIYTASHQASMRMRFPQTHDTKRLFFSFWKELDKARRDLNTEGVSEQVLEKIAENTAISIENVRLVWVQVSGIASMQETVKSSGDGGGELLLGDAVVDTKVDVQRDFEEEEVAELRSDVIMRAIEGLSDREKTIIRERHLKDEEDRLTLDQIGEQFGVTRERVRQIEAGAMKKLRKLLAERLQAEDIDLREIL